MASTSTIEDALTRLEAALERLEGAVDRRFDSERRASDLQSEVHRLGTDRSQLAQTLDAAEERSARLDEANREVSRRLVAAMESIKDLLDRHGG
jgi:predicted  nucleic acid-binding Zn-ribbon protein